MTNLPIITNAVDDIATGRNTANTIINLSNTFDDPFTSGQVASFNIGGEVTNVVLFDQEGEGAPIAVANFLDYVNDGSYLNSIIHRSIPGFIVQGGGFTVDGLADNLANPADAVSEIPSNDPIVNEFSADRSNLRGTIAFAKLGGDPDSATNQWFFNLGDNSANLDVQNGGFTVFGEVLAESDLANLDAIAEVPTFPGADFFEQGAFTDLPLNVADPTNPIITGDENFVRYNSITVAEQSELTFSIVSNSNASLVNPIIEDNQLVLDYVDAQEGTAEITIRATGLTGEFVEETFSVAVDEPVDDSILESSLTRFQNSDVPGTFIFVSGDEAASIRDDFSQFEEEGVAFNAAIAPDDDLIPFYRFQNEEMPGTFLFVDENERDNINADPNFSDIFTEEGIAFYVYGAGSNEAVSFSRFQNSAVPGTFIYATGDEANNIRNNFPQFVEEGIAFEAEI